ncbi:YeeE/YedE thiosulfate transporter family protein [Desulfurivibrio sp. D14AmB]|uniref:YeeE/YedE thiosulfate transporter family protein n=1 Tax=Desulfurivibrio sp. D14AmB TaxID=3374370 RepID=UPI00376EC59E
MATSKWYKPYLLGGLAGLLLTASVLFANQFFGTSTTFPRAATWLVDLVGIDLSHLDFYQVRGGALTGASFPNWQLLFVLGIGIGAFISSLLTGTFKLERLPPMWVARFGDRLGLRIVHSLLGGVLVMLGARMAGGCPSGHGVSGVSQLGVSSLLALAMFFVGGIITARIIYRGGK